MTKTTLKSEKLYRKEVRALLVGVQSFNLLLLPVLVNWRKDTKQDLNYTTLVKINKYFLRIITHKKIMPYLSYIIFE